VLLFHASLVFPHFRAYMDRWLGFEVLLEELFGLWLKACVVYMRSSKPMLTFRVPALKSRLHLSHGCVT
jgi:hypothetical protein